jgi:upstream-binding transcription factor
VCNRADMAAAAASKRLREWIRVMSDPVREPWSDWDDDDDLGAVQVNGNDVVVADPTADFVLRSDRDSECGEDDDDDDDDDDDEEEEDEEEEEESSCSSDSSSGTSSSRTNAGKE